MFKKNAAPVSTPDIGWKSLKTSHKALLALAVLAFLGFGTSYYFYGKYRELSQNPNAEAQRKTEAYVSAIGKLMELPQDEAPTVATILDKDKLRDQPFFALAENDDVLLAYTGAAMKAILYRPSTNKIINVGPITINNQQAAAPEGAVMGAMDSTVRIAYFNGSATVGLTGTAEATVKAKYGSSQTVALKNAAKNTYASTVVVDLSGSHGAEATDIAALLGGSVGSLPEGESAPADTDLLVILGK